MFKIATVHGRFQPPHLEHLEYMLAALSLTEHLMIGITQPDSDKLLDCPEDPHRAEVRSNPLSFEERCGAIQAMLSGIGIDGTRFSFVRFPIEAPEKLSEIVPLGTVCFTTIRDEWNVVKIRRLEDLGYDVKVLWDRSEKAGIQGTEIRRKIQKHDPTWIKNVHPAVVDFLNTEGIIDRMVENLNG